MKHYDQLLLPLGESSFLYWLFSPSSSHRRKEISIIFSRLLKLLPSTMYTIMSTPLGQFFSKLWHQKCFLTYKKKKKRQVWFLRGANFRVFFVALCDSNSIVTCHATLHSQRASEANWNESCVPLLFDIDCVCVCYWFSLCIWPASTTNSNQEEEKGNLIVPCAAAKSRVV